MFPILEVFTLSPLGMKSLNLIEEVFLSTPSTLRAFIAKVVEFIQWGFGHMVLPLRSVNTVNFTDRFWSV